MAHLFKGHNHLLSLRGIRTQGPLPEFFIYAPSSDEDPKLGFSDGEMVQDGFCIPG